MPNFIRPLQSRSSRAKISLNTNNIPQKLEQLKSKHYFTLLSQQQEYVSKSEHNDQIQSSMQSIPKINQYFDNTNISSACTSRSISIERAHEEFNNIIEIFDRILEL